MHVSCISDAAGFDALRADWEALEQACDDTTPFNTWQWLRSWWHHYGSNRSLRLLVVRGLDGDRLEAIAPFYLNATRNRFRTPIRELCLLGSGSDTSPDYLNVLTRSETRDVALGAIFDAVDAMRDWHQLRFTDIPKEAPLARYLSQRYGRAPGVFRPIDSHTLFVAELPQDWDSYRLSLTRKRRKQINHRRNRLDAAGTWSLAVCDTRDTLDEAIAALESLHRDRWKSKGAKGGFLSDAYVNFHREVIREFYARDALWLTTLRLNGDIIGVQYIYLMRDTLYFFQSGYAPAHTDLSPGHVLFTYAIAEAIERGIGHIDLLKGDYEYKTVYASDEQYTIAYRYVRRGVRAWQQRCVDWLRDQRDRREARQPAIAPATTIGTQSAPGGE